MVAPVTGPFIQNTNDGYEQKIRSWYRQKPPFNLNLAYECRIGRVLKLDASNPGGTASYWRLVGDGEAPGAEALYAKAYDRLVDKIDGETASMGINIAQWGQASKMIENRAVQLSRFAVNLARRSPVGVAATLGLRVSDVKALMGRRYGAQKKLSDLWLEFWFGWKPFVQDIYAAAEVFDHELPATRIKASAGRKEPTRLRFGSGQPWSFSGKWALNLKCRLGCTARVVNPNTDLMRRFGILNPFEIAFDAVPWSFTLGWFSNVNSWLRSITDFAGLEISDTWRSYITLVDNGETWNPNNPLVGSRGSAVNVWREVNTPFKRPDLAFTFKPPSLTRATTAISLLTQKLPRH